MQKYENNVYTWDYVMEQKRKREWDTLHPGDHNPYADLPELRILTFDLGKSLPTGRPCTRFSSSACWRTGG